MNWANVIECSIWCPWIVNVSSKTNMDTQQNVSYMRMKKKNDFQDFVEPLSKKNSINFG